MLLVVVRDGVDRRLPVDQVVVGDLIRLTVDLPPIVGPCASKRASRAGSLPAVTWRLG
jgi:hypothetical protein